ncbi:MAG: glycosyltransferase family 4 protein [Phycisphaerae bacterium]|nr:glycosyltransferase family 4 protein [Phycisphaerae bacterium]
MRIAMIGTRGLGASEGGVERVVELLAAGLSARGHEMLVYGRERCISHEPVRVGGQSIVTAGFGGKHLEALTHTATACWDVLRRQVDVVHVHSPGPALLLPLVVAAGLPTVLTIHAPDWRREKWSRPARLALRAGLSTGMRLADRVTAVAPHLARELERQFGRSVTVVPNAVEPWRIGDEADLRRWHLAAGRYVLHVGRIVPEKRLDVLIDAWRRAGLDVPLVVAGGVGEAGYARRCRRESPDGVYWLGAVRPDVLDSLYAHARFVVQPSVLEGASLVLHEAATHGRCVIASSTPANREVLDAAALWVPPDDAAALAEAMIRCHNDAALRRETGHLASEHVATSFTIQRMVSTMESMYKAISRGGRIT